MYVCMFLIKLSLNTHTHTHEQLQAVVIGLKSVQGNLSTVSNHEKEDD